MRYRIVIEIDSDLPQHMINELAERLYKEAFVSGYYKPVFLSTENVENTLNTLRIE